MNILVRKSSYIIRKGDGVYAYYDGQPHLLTSPPPEAFHPSKDKPDVPLFAHYGNGKPHPNGHHGMGELIPGKFVRGKYGELAYDDGQYHHHHGIDGVIHAVGRALEEAGMDGGHHPQLGELTPQNLIQKAIDITNERHEDTTGFHHIPDVDDMEHRKIRASGFTGREATVRPNRSKSGDYITAFTNRLNPQEKIGAFIESYSVPYNNALQEILINKLGLKSLVNAEWLQNNYISIDDLHPMGRRLKGRGGDQINAFFQGRGSLPATHLKNAPEGITHDAAHTGIQSWEVVHHAPDFFHMTLNRQQTGPKNARDSARVHIAEAMKVLDPDKIPDVDVPINTTPGSTGVPRYSMMNLRTVLRSPTMMDNMIDELSKTPAFQKLFGRINAGGTKNPSPGKRAFEHLLEAFGGDPDKGATFDSLSTHVRHGPHLETEEGHVPTKKLGTHAQAAKFFSKVMLSGPHEDGTSAMRHYMPDDATLQELGLSLPSLQTAHVRRTATEALGDMLSEAFGHQVRRPIPDEIPQGALSSAILHYPQEHIPSLPQHVPFYSDVSLPPVAKPPVEDTRPTHGPSADAQPTSAPLGGAVAPPPETTTPKQIPPRAAPTPTSASAPQQFPKPLSPQYQEARRFLGEADPEVMREMARNIGVPLRTGEPGTPLSPMEQRFQQHFGDPRQNLLTQYMKSISQDLSPMDRVMKAMELMQLDDARTDSKIMKHALTRQINIADLHGLNYLAKNIDLTPVDIRSIAYSVGDWERIAKRLNVTTDQVKVVKLSVGGV